MAWLIVGLVVFLGVHMVSVIAPDWRNAQVARIGEGPWKGLYSLASAVGLGLIVWGYGAARASSSALYVLPSGMRHLALLLMLPVFPLLIATYLRGRIQRTVGNPMLIAVILWSVAHLLANGSVADTVLFGSVLLWAVLDLASARRRPARSGPGLPFKPVNDIVSIAVGLAIYAAFLVGLHRWLFGVAPLAMAG